MKNRFQNVYISRGVGVRANLEEKKVYILTFLEPFLYGSITKNKTVSPIANSITRQNPTACNLPIYIDITLELCDLNFLWGIFMSV